MQRSKVLTYVGFAIRSGNLRTGVNAISTLRRADLLVVCKTASSNTVKDAESLAKKFNCPLVLSGTSVEEITGKENCKLMAVTDESLAGAIMNNLDDNFTVISGGYKK